MDTERNETLREAAKAYLEHLKAEGKKERTLATYGRDFQQIMDHFGRRESSRVFYPSTSESF